MRELPHDRIFVKAYAFSGQARSWNVWGQMIDRTADRTVDWSGWFQVHQNGQLKLGWPEAGPRENRNRLFHCVWMYGKSYQCSDSVKVRVVARVETLLASHPEVQSMVAGEVQHLTVTGQEIVQRPEKIRGESTMESNETKIETKTAKAPKVTFGQCQVVPRPTSKAGETRCPRMITKENEYNVCGGHLAFINRGSETRLLDGRTLNQKPAAEPKPTKSTEPAKQDEITSAAPAVPVDATPALKKLTKKQKGQAALAVLSAKQAAKNDAAVDTGMVQRSTPNGQ